MYLYVLYIHLSPPTYTHTYTCTNILLSKFCREREEGESPNDHNDRMIRAVASFLQDQLSMAADADNDGDGGEGVEVVLVTYDRANAAKAKEEGLKVRIHVGVMVRYGGFMCASCVGYPNPIHPRNTHAHPKTQQRHQQTTKQQALTLSALVSQAHPELVDLLAVPSDDTGL